MHVRSRLTILTAVALPLAGLVTFGGVQQFAEAGGGPVLTCTNVTGGGSNQNAVTFTDASNNTVGIALNSAPAETGATTANADNGSSTVVINQAVTKGQTLTIVGFTGTYLVTNDNYPGLVITPSPHIVVSPDTVTVSPPLAGGTVVLVKNANPALDTLGVKAKAVVNINATDGTNNTTAFNGSINENLNLDLSSCTSSQSAPGDFAPTGVNVTGSSSATNSAASLEKNPGLLNGNVTFPTIGAGYVQPVPTAIGFNIAKSNTINLGDFGISYAKGVVTGDYATTKSTLTFLALGGMTVCSESELQAIASGTGPDGPGGANLSSMEGTYATTGITSGSDPLVVCDSGSNPAFSPTVSQGKYNGLDEILAAETAQGGTTVTAGDGSNIGAIYAIQIDANGNNVI
jgi:hypothetical protein